jgi:hypothetical protein
MSTERRYSLRTYEDPKVDHKTKLSLTETDPEMRRIDRWASANFLVRVPFEEGGTPLNECPFWDRIVPIWNMLDLEPST